MVVGVIHEILARVPSSIMLVAPLCTVDQPQRRLYPLSQSCGRGGVTKSFRLVHGTLTSLFSHLPIPQHACTMAQQGQTSPHLPSQEACGMGNA
jgi:hypothetical protein